MMRLCWGDSSRVLVELSSPAQMRKPPSPPRCIADGSFSRYLPATHGTAMVDVCGCAETSGPVLLVLLYYRSE